MLTTTQRCSDPCSHHRHVVQERGAREACLVVLRMQFSYADLCWLRCVRRQLCTWKFCDLANLLHRYWGYDHGRWAFGSAATTRLAGPGQALYGCSKGGCPIESQSQSEVSIPTMSEFPRRVYHSMFSGAQK